MRTTPKGRAPSASERRGRAARFILNEFAPETGGVRRRTYRKDSICSKKRSGASQKGMWPEEGSETTSALRYIGIVARIRQRQRILLAMNDDCRGRNGTRFGAPIVAISPQSREHGRARFARRMRRCKVARHLGVGEPRRIHRSAVVAVQHGVGIAERFLGNASDGLALFAVQAIEHALSQRRHPVAGVPDRIDEHESSNAHRVARGGEHRDAAAPRVSEHDPTAECRARDAARRRRPRRLRSSRRPGSRCRRASAPALVVQDDLPAFRERRECGPQHGMVVQHSAVHAHERRRRADRRTGEHGEVDSARAHGLPVERRSAGQRAAKGDEIGVGHSVGRVDGRLGERVTSTAPQHASTGPPVQSRQT